MTIEGAIGCAQGLSSVDMTRICIALISCVLFRGGVLLLVLSFKNKNYGSCVDDEAYGRVELICVVRFCTFS